MTSPNLRSVAADSNVLLSAIVGKAASRVFNHPELIVVTTEDNAAEVREYLPEFAKRYGVSEESLLEAFELLPIEVFGKHRYSTHLFEARSLLAERDADDVPLAALALKLGIPIWSNDRDFDEFPTGTFSTAKLLKVLGV
ncbi:MAG: PIN domain nuclease [Acidobacteria bacterium]|nr:PIN domain nuclease [Acidobacteriota bacterium]